MNRPQENEYPQGIASYIALVPEDDVVGVLAAQANEIAELFANIGEMRSGHRYAEGKWSIREVAGHLSDAERVFGYRIFAIARGEQQPLPGFDENAYMAASSYDNWSLNDLAASFAALREANLLLLRGLSEAALSRAGTANGKPVTARAIAFATAGHARHHVNILHERYL